MAEGGVAVALAECCVAGATGAQVDLIADTTTFFGEAIGGFVLSGDEAALRALDCELRIVGTVGGQDLRIGDDLEVPVAELAETYRAGLAPFFP